MRSSVRKTTTTMVLANKISPVESVVTVEKTAAEGAAETTEPWYQRDIARMQKRMRYFGRGKLGLYIGLFVFVLVLAIVVVAVYYRGKSVSLVSSIHTSDLVTVYCIRSHRHARTPTHKHTHTHTPLDYIRAGIQIHSNIV